MNRLYRSALIFLLALSAVPAFAATFIVPEDKTLIQRADAIVIASALSNYTELSASGAVQTVTPISIEEVLKGDLLPGIIALREPGGHYGDRVTIIPGIPQFAPGERLLLFLTRTPRREWAVTEIALGKFSFAFDINGKRIALRQEHDINGWDLDGEPHKEQHREASQFVRYIRDVVARQKTNADYFVANAPIKAVTITGLQPQPAASGFSPTSYTLDLDGATGTGKGGRWTRFPSAVNWTNTNTLSNAPNGGVDAINAAMGAWNNECQSNVNYVRTGSDPSKTSGLSGAPDNANTIIFERDLTALGIPGPYVCNTGGTLGVGGITQASTPLNTLAGESFWTVTEGDVEFRQGVNACTSYVQSTNFITAVTHELGHTLGFRHSDQNRARPAGSCSSTAGLECSSAAVMTATVPNGLGAGLAAWDVNAVSTLYPGGTCGGGPGSRVRGDFNGDAKADVVWRSSTDGLNYIWFLNGATLLSAASLPTVSDLAWKVVASGDFNGDGFNDLFFRRDTGENYMWLMNGATLLSSSPMPNVEAAWKVAGAGDFNADGKADLFWRRDTGENYVWLLNGSTLAASTSTTAVFDSAWKVGGTGDFNADGKDDLFWHRDSGENYMWIMNGAAVTSSTALPTIADPLWRVAAVRDFNGDTRADVFWRRDTGENYMWIIDGTTVAAITPMPNVPDTSWHVAAAGDFNGDGRSDLFWHRDSGENYVWLLSGSTLLSSAGMATQDPKWRPVAPK